MDKKGPGFLRNKHILINTSIQKYIWVTGYVKKIKNSCVCKMEN